MVTSSWRHQLPRDTHLMVVINRANSDVCAPGSFGGVQRDRQNCTLSIRFIGKLSDFNLPVTVTKRKIKTFILRDSTGTN